MANLLSPDSILKSFVVLKMKRESFLEEYFVLEGLRKLFQYYFLAFVLFFSFLSLMKFSERRREKKKLFEHFFLLKDTRTKKLNSLFEL